MPKRTREETQLKLLRGEPVPNRHSTGVRTAGVATACDYLRQNGERCKQPSGAGTQHKGFGACRHHGGNSPAHNVSAARMAVRQMAQELCVDPVTALLSTVHQTAGMVQWVRNQIETFEGNDDPETFALELGLLAELYDKERNNLAKFSKMAIDAGIAERQVQLAEATAQVLVHAIRGVLGGLTLTDEQMALAPGLIRTHLMSIPADSEEAV